MGLIEKAYFELDEVSEHCGVPMRDLAYMAENGLLRVSVRLFRVHIEKGIYEPDDQHGPIRVPLEQTWFSGLQDLSPCDAFKVFRDGQASIGWFDAPDDDAYIVLIEPNEWIEVRRDWLVIRREQRDRVEASSKETLGLVDRFEHSGDYRNVRIGSLELALGTVQANVVRALHAAALSDQPWCVGKALLRGAGATSMRMRDTFKSQKEWPRLIESDNRGRYRLRLKPE
jgi:hypothetical protein